MIELLQIPSHTLGTYPLPFSNQVHKHLCFLEPSFWPSMGLVLSCSSCTRMYPICQASLHPQDVRVPRGVPGPMGHVASAPRSPVVLLLHVVLMEWNLDVNQQSVADHQSTALHAASFKGFSIPVALLLSKGGNPSILNAAKMTARQEARGVRSPSPLSPSVPLLMYNFSLANTSLHLR